jgi:hypothetical protein
MKCITAGRSESLILIVRQEIVKELGICLPEFGGRPRPAIDKGDIIRWSMHSIAARPFFPIRSRRFGDDERTGSVRRRDDLGPRVNRA